MRFDDVTLVTVETFYHDLAKRAMEETLQRIPFKNVVVFSDKNFLPGSTWVPIQPTVGMKDYCDVILKTMWPSIGTSHIIFQQWDAMVWNANAWTDEFLDYDYIGPVWPWHQPGYNVGNGGFSLRSKKLLTALRDPVINMDPAGPHGIQEDNYICIAYKDYLRKKYDIKYAEPDLADRFGHEMNGTGIGSMGFHGFWNIVKFMPRDTVEFYVKNAPKNTWNEIHRAHHTIVAMAVMGYVDLLESQADLIKAGPEFSQLYQWLAQEQFSNHDAVMKALS